MQKIKTLAELFLLAFCLLIGVLVFTACTTVSLKDCSTACRFGKLGQYQNESSICKCATVKEF